MSQECLNFINSNPYFEILSIFLFWIFQIMFYEIFRKFIFPKSKLK